MNIPITKGPFIERRVFLINGNDALKVGFADNLFDLVSENLAGSLNHIYSTLPRLHASLTAGRKAKAPPHARARSVFQRLGWPGLSMSKWVCPECLAWRGQGSIFAPFLPQDSQRILHPGI
ncbi:MAG: hypothetical protein IPK53_10740 [bacterium]|nr:hypothetical protein [bacterium]